MKIIKIGWNFTSKNTKTRKKIAKKKNKKINCRKISKLSRYIPEFWQIFELSRYIPEFWQNLNTSWPIKPVQLNGGGGVQMLNCEIFVQI